MSIIGGLVAKAVISSAKGAIVKAVGDATTNAITSSLKKDDKETTTKNGVDHIKSTRSSYDYKGQNAIDIASELLCAGFECIALKPIKKLNERSIKKYGNINSITINGKQDFSQGKKFPASSYIIIEYLDFNYYVNPNIRKHYTHYSVYSS